MHIFDVIRGFSKKNLCQGAGVDGKCDHHKMKVRATKSGRARCVRATQKMGATHPLQR